MKTSVTGLYFCAGAIPTEEERAEARALGITAFRNASLVFEDSPVENAALVAGKVPAVYRLIKGQRIATGGAQAKPPVSK